MRKWHLNKRIWLILGEDYGIEQNGRDIRNSQRRPMIEMNKIGGIS
jgi:hypothetical protein